MRKAMRACKYVDAKVEEAKANNRSLTDRRKNEKETRASCTTVSAKNETEDQLESALGGSAGRLRRGPTLPNGRPFMATLV